MYFTSKRWEGLFKKSPELDDVLLWFSNTKEAFIYKEKQKTGSLPCLVFLYHRVKIP